MTKNKQKLELTWLKKYDESLPIEPRILIENKKYSHGTIDNGVLLNGKIWNGNMLIHGDNLLALKALLQDYAGQVKCIYIDPPYNTGKAFDNYEDNVEHSTWLNLMYKRILILKELLSEEGFLCCQIDDSEGAYLKVLLDEVFGRENYLATFYIQVRYPNKTLAEDSDYQKVIEQCHIYAKQKYKAKLNRPVTEYDISKFEWEIQELEHGEVIELGNKSVEIFKPHQYKIKKIQPSLKGLKETWATGSLTRVKASAGEFFELYLSNRKQIDGLGCLYKVSGIGEDGLGYRYISGPKQENANKGKFYSGIPLKRLRELKTGKSYKYLPVTNFYDFAGAFGNCRLEGGVGFKGGKKPEILLKTIFDYFSNEGDLVLDSFLGSGTTAAVAHKMNRKYIGIEMGEHCHTLCETRLNNVINGDKTGISKAVNWQGGGGYKFYELAPSLLKKDEFGNWIIDSRYDAEMLAEAMAKQEGYQFSPDEENIYKQGYSTEKDFIFTTTQFLSIELLDKIYSKLKGDESLLICATHFEEGTGGRYDNITVKKIPQMLLNRCEFGKLEYNLNIIDPPQETEDDEEILEEE